MKTVHIILSTKFVNIRVSLMEYRDLFFFLHESSYIRWYLGSTYVRENTGSACSRHELHGLCLTRA